MNTSDHYIIMNSLNLKKDMIQKAETLLRMAKEQSPSSYYVIDAKDYYEAQRIYVNLVPQISVEVKKHSKKDMNVILGFHKESTRGNTAIYQ